MRMLSSLIVVCVVAATLVRPVDARGDVRAAAIERAAQPAAYAHATRPCLHAIGERRAHAPDLYRHGGHPPVTLGTPFALRVPPTRTLARTTDACERIFAALIATRSARGPPIA